MHDIIGREAEIAILKKMVNSNQAEFLAIWGRRRIGKTYLIRKFFEQYKKCTFFHSTGLKDGLLQEQLDIFTSSLREIFYAGISTPSKWTEAFAHLTEMIKLLPGTDPVIIFLDELPWMASPKSRLLQAIDHYWNSKWSMMPRIKLIICGSAASWMIKNILHNKGGLHNRLTQRMQLLPFNLVDVNSYLRYKNIILNNAQIIELYMAMGGVPYYLNSVQPGLSATQNINQICFNKRGLLFSEYDELFKSLFTNSTVHRKLVSILIKNKSGLTRKQIADKSKTISLGGRLSERLAELEAAGFIQQFVPYGNKIKDVYYKLIDEYIIFYLQWIAPNKTNLSSNRAAVWEQLVLTAKYSSWAGYAFEAICFKHVDQIATALGIFNIGSLAASWRYIAKNDDTSNGAQIDLLFDRFDKTVTLCEIKYYSKDFALDQKSYEDLLRKQKVFIHATGCRKQIFWCLITLYPIRSNSYSSSLPALNVTSDDLFKAIN